MSKTNSILVGILMGSDSDWPVMKAAADALNDFGVGSGSQGYLRAPRSPRLGRICQQRHRTRPEGYHLRRGGAAHLAGVTAAFTTLPVIGVPILGKSTDGFDSLLSMVQMPPGVPVATVAINGGRNAGILAAQILATGDARLQDEMKKFKVKLTEESRAKNKTLAQ